MADLKRKADQTPPQKPPLRKQRSVDLSEAKKLLEQTKDEIKSEAELLEKKVAEAGAKQVVPGVTRKQMIDAMNRVDVPGDPKDSGFDIFQLLCTKTGGQVALFQLYRMLYEQHTSFVSTVQDYSRSAAMSLETLESCQSLQDCEDHNSDFDDASVYVADIENAADAMASDLYQAQVLN